MLLGVVVGRRGLELLDYFVVNFVDEPHIEFVTVLVSIFFKQLVFSLHVAHKFFGGQHVVGFFVPPHRLVQISKKW